MELVINFALRTDGERSIPVEDIRIRELAVKDADEIVEEINRQLEDIIHQVLEHAGIEDNDEGDDE